MSQRGLRTQAIPCEGRTCNKKIKALQTYNIPRHGIFSMFLTSIKGYNSVRICRNLPFRSPITFLPNINSHTMFEENR